jgi:hypothetical protein
MKIIAECGKLIKDNVKKRLEANNSQADEAQKNSLKAIEMVSSTNNNPVIVYTAYAWYDCLPGWISYNCSVCGIGRYRNNACAHHPSYFSSINY